MRSDKIGWSALNLVGNVEGNRAEQRVLQSVSLEGDHSSLVVDLNGKQIRSSSSQKMGLDLNWSELELTFESRQLHQEVKLDGLVNLGDLLKQFVQDHTGQWLDVHMELLVLLKILEDTLGFGSKRDWVEVFLHELVQLGKNWVNNAQDVSGSNLLQKGLSGWNLREVEQDSQSVVLSLDEVVGLGRKIHWNS
ncbi:hypothetical protein OGAPHI_005149 [Ogataea philodendri]|uniref:Uncharacterized protein n=1 Tax=Ogataea philodendri TaxID=1378263 RepID=A0A9P8P2Q8_9ASCO|nr:uncharacterized protein OGAPHI_005149 [Ogataea philodendri]KAH3663747.1 hypothetical protein OGAPHI_005149 [Ogataea philodendri]